MKKITIATPMYGGQCTGIFAKSLVQATIGLKIAGYDVDFIDLYNESLITRARNVLTYMFLNSESDYLLFIDADQSFRTEDILRMIEHDKDIIAAPVPMKGLNWDQVKKAHELGFEYLPDFSGIFNINYNEKSAGLKMKDPIPVTHAGTGMMLIKRDVFEKLADSVDEYRYDGTPIAKHNLEKGSMVKNYWDTAVRGGRLLSEDYNFCAMWQDLGGEVYVDALAVVSHVGTYMYSGKLMATSVLNAKLAENAKAEESENP